MRSGREERSSRPAAPSARQRASHLPAVWRLTPAASAAAISFQPPDLDALAEEQTSVRGQSRVTMSHEGLPLGLGLDTNYR